MNVGRNTSVTTLLLWFSLIHTAVLARNRAAVRNLVGAPRNHLH